MNQVIHKFVLSVAERQTIELPPLSKILHVHEQYGNLVLWALVNKDSKDKETRTIEIAGTGMDMKPENRKYIGTAHVNSYVWHVFEIV